MPADSMLSKSIILVNFILFPSVLFTPERHVSRTAAAIAKQVELVEDKPV